MKTVERFSTILLVAGIGFFLLSFVGMGLAPWTTLRALRPPEGAVQRSELEELGRQIFIHEACWHCHTQFVRPVSNEEVRYGPVSSPAEYVNEIPQLFGTRRVGPDLSRESGRRSDDWHYAHFYNPRSVAPWSVMPGFPWLFEKQDGKIVPRRGAQALVAYMQSLGRVKMDQVRVSEDEFRKNFRVGIAPPRTPGMMDRGRDLFARECSGCHGPRGDGEGSAKDLLLPAAQDLTRVHTRPEYVYEILQLGVPGSSMPHFRDYSNNDLWSLAYYVEGLFDAETSARPEFVKATDEVLKQGEQVFKLTCATCHGPRGLGDGAGGAALKPPPGNLQGLRPSAVRIHEVLQTGVAGTGMIAFPTLSEDDKWAVALFIEKMTGSPLAPSAPAATPAPTPTAVPEETAAAAEAPEPTAELLLLGKRSFDMTCVTCHGVSGNGDTPAGKALNPPAADFTDDAWKHGSSVEEIHKVIHDGVAGTGMVAWSSLGEKTVWSLAYYVKSFTDPELRKVVE